MTRDLDRDRFTCSISVLIVQVIHCTTRNAEYAYMRVCVEFVST